MNLLIVDDEMFAIQGIVDDVPWEQLKFENIFTANSYAQAVNVFRNHKVDILLCDIEMPMGSGIDLVRWVREHYTSVECIFLTCHADFDFAKEAVSLSCMGYILKPAETEEIVALLQKAKSRLESSGELQRYREYGKLYLENVKEQAAGPEERDAVSLAERYIREHLDMPISMDELVDATHVSSAHLGRLFKKKKGVTLIDYITAQRMELAKELLLDERLTVSTVAARVGYNNYSYFTRAFGKYTGFSPREYRKKKRTEQ